jgi:hypothetical protein
VLQRFLFSFLDEAKIIYAVGVDRNSRIRNHTVNKRHTLVVSDKVVYSDESARGTASIAVVRDDATTSTRHRDDAEAADVGFLIRLKKELAMQF